MLDKESERVKKIEEWKDERERREQAGLTFAPQINTHGKKRTLEEMI